MASQQVLAALRDELDTDPLARGYGPMTDAQVVTSIGAVDRPAPLGLSEAIKYMTATRHSTGNGSDTNAIPLIARLVRVADGTPETDILGTTVSVNTRRWSNCIAFLEILRSPQLGTLLWDDADLDQLLNQVVNAEVMDGADKNVITALSNNAQSRATELSLGVIREGEVAAARAL